MKFVWDPQKASSNLRKHGISFDEAVTVFKDPLAYIFDDMEHSEQEHREIIIGMSVLRRMLLVCFVEKRNYLPLDEEWLAYCSKRQKYPQISQIAPIFFSHLCTLRNLRMISNGG